MSTKDDIYTTYIIVQSFLYSHKSVVSIAFFVILLIKASNAVKLSMT